MNRLFNSLTDRTRLKVGLIDYVRSIISERDVKVYVATDSCVKGRYVHYAVVVALRFESKGAHVVYRKILIPRNEVKDNFTRLFRETEFSVDVANFLKASGVNVEAIELDYNQDKTWFSYKLLSSCEGWCKSLGYKTVTKPDNMIAARAADKICNGL